MTTPSTCATIIKTRTQMSACVSSTVESAFWNRARVVKGQSWVTQQQQALLGGYAAIESAYIFQLVPVQQTTQGVTVIVGDQVQQQGQVLEETHPQNLAQANFVYAAEVFSDMPVEQVHDYADRLGVRQDVAEIQMRSGCAIMTAYNATEANTLIPDAIETERQKQGASGGSSFWDKFSNGLKKLTTHPGDWLQRVFVTEPGKALQFVGRNLLSDAVPGWARWILDPLGIAKQIGTFMQQLGIAMVSGHITDFDERAFMIANAQHWRQVGEALAVAAPFLPPPWDIVAFALSAVFIGAATAILTIYQQAAAQRAREEDAANAEARAKAAKEAAAAAQANADYQDSLLGVDSMPANRSNITVAVVAVGAIGILSILGISFFHYR